MLSEYLKLEYTTYVLQKKNLKSSTSISVLKVYTALLILLYEEISESTLQHGHCETFNSQIYLLVIILHKALTQKYIYY